MFMRMIGIQANHDPLLSSGQFLHLLNHLRADGRPFYHPDAFEKGMIFDLFSVMRPDIYVNSHPLSPTDQLEQGSIVHKGAAVRNPRLNDQAWFYLQHAV